MTTDEEVEKLVDNATKSESAQSAPASSKWVNIKRDASTSTSDSNETEQTTTAESEQETSTTETATETTTN